MNFLFDIGNVIVGIDFITPLSRLLPSPNDDPATTLASLMERKDEFEAGRISESEYFPWAAKSIGFTGDMDTFMRAWTGIFSPNQPMWDIISQLHADGHRLILFSNIQSAHLHYLQKNYPVFDLFSGGIFSYQTGHIKPEPEIYQLAIDQYNLTAEDTIYIDDLPANIEGGQKAGFICHQYNLNDHSRFLSWLHAYSNDI